MTKLLIIHPIDETTAFLNPIWHHLQKTFNESIEVIIVEPNDEAHEKAKMYIYNYQFNNILFLGHGNSTCLIGAKNENYSCENFITKNDINFFSKKNILSFSCRSIDFFKDYNFFNYIGFDDIPTEMTEVIAARDYDNNAYAGVDQDVIIEFNNILVQVIGNSVYEWIIYNYNIENVYNRIRLRINQMIVIYSNNESKKPLIRLLIKLKNEMNYNYNY